MAARQCPRVVPGGCERHLCLECCSGETRTALPGRLGFSWQMQAWEGCRVGRAQVFPCAVPCGRSQGSSCQGRAAWVELPERALEIPALVGIGLNLQFVFLSVELLLQHPKGQLLGLCGVWELRLKGRVGNLALGRAGHRFWDAEHCWVCAVPAEPLLQPRLVCNPC